MVPFSHFKGPYPAESGSGLSPYCPQRPHPCPGKQVLPDAPHNPLLTEKIGGNPKVSPQHRRESERDSSPLASPSLNGEVCPGRTLDRSAGGQGQADLGQKLITPPMAMVRVSSSAVPMEMVLTLYSPTSLR